MTPTNSTPSTPARKNSWAMVGFGLVLVVAAFVRIRGAMNDLWLDEVWAIEVAKLTTSVPQIFTGLHHEINHYLYTWWIYEVGQHGNWWGYRAPSLISGIGTAILAWFIGRRRSEADGWFALILVGLSYPLVVYGSEARGYSTAIFCAFAAYLLLQSFHERPRWFTALGFAGCEIVGLFSHLLFVNMLAATLVWSAWVYLRSNESWPARIRHGAMVHLLPGLALMGLYFADIRYLHAGGGTNTASLIDSFGSALAWAVGTPGTSRTTLIACIAAVVLLNIGWGQLRREKPADSVFLIAVILVFPIALVVVRSSDAVYPRHFLLSIAFLLLLLARILVDFWNAGGRRRQICLGILAAYICLNSLNICRLFVYGRGQSGELVQYLSRGVTPGAVVSVGADNDLRVHALIHFYSPFLSGGKPVQYFKGGSWPAGGVDFFVCTQEAFEWPNEPQIDGYELARTFRAAPLAGLHFFVFQKKKA